MISILCPTRGRPASILRLADSVADTAAGGYEIVLYVDDDDQPTRDLLAGLPAPGSPIRPIIGPRTVLSRCWNTCAAVARGDILMHCGDDIVFRTPGWDRMVADAFEQYPDRILFAHGRDGLRDQALGTHGFLHRRWVATVGYFVPPYFSCDYNDTWLTEVADAIGRRRYLPEVYTEHLHPDAGKAEWDVTHRARKARGAQDNVEALYNSLAHERAADAAKLRAAMFTEGV